MSQDLDALIAKHQETPEGQFALNRVIHDFAGIVPLFENDETRPQGEQLIKFWMEEGSDLRKGIAGAWLARAAHNVHGAIKGAHPTIGRLKGMYGKVEGAAESAGAAAGKLASHVDVRGKAKAVSEAAGRMNTSAIPASHPQPNVPHAIGPHAGAHDHAEHFARMGAVAGKWGFRAGLAAAGAGGVAAGVQHQRRANASTMGGNQFNKGILNPDNLMKGIGKAISPGFNRISTNDKSFHDTPESMQDMYADCAAPEQALRGAKKKPKMRMTADHPGIHRVVSKLLGTYDLEKKNDLTPDTDEQDSLDGGEQLDPGAKRKFGSSPRSVEQTIRMPGSYVRRNGSPTLLGAPKKKKVGSQDVGSGRKFGSSERSVEQTVTMPGRYVGHNGSPTLQGALRTPNVGRQDSHPHTQFGAAPRSAPENTGASTFMGKGLRAEASVLGAAINPFDNIQARNKRVGAATRARKKSLLMG